MNKISLELPVGGKEAITALELLAAESGLAKSRLKDAMIKGAVWLRKKKSRGLKRLRRAKTILTPGDYLELHYDPELLALIPPEPELLQDLTHYSVWFKPAGLLAQGNRFGDHASLLRCVELFFKPLRPVFLIHRLDRETAGIMLVAHSQQAASALSKLFREKKLVKRYRAEVLGDLRDYPKTTIDFDLEGKTALTVLETSCYSPERHTSTVTATIQTGRHHQIRQHFAMIGHPVMGDPKYGQGNKNRDGLKLEAISLSFRCPLLHQKMEFKKTVIVEDEKTLKCNKD